MRIHGRIGKVQVGTKPPVGMSPDTAILGIFPFEIAGRAAPQAKNAALLDHGIASNSGQSLHRLTLELSSMSWDSVRKSQAILPVDLYFDPATHLLIKSACYVFIPGGKQIPFLSVVTYGDYRRVGASMVPFLYSETLDGQPYRTVQLSAVQLTPNFPTDYFQFQGVK